MSQTPPNHPEAELAVLGSMMIEREACLLARRILKPSDFYGEKNRIIFENAVALTEEPGVAVVDLVTLACKLRESGKLTEAGGAAYLSQTYAKMSSAAHVEHYAKIVRRASIDREILGQLARTTENATHEAVTALGKLIYSRDALTAYDILNFQTDLAEAIETLLDNMPQGYLTGFGRLDHLFVGLQPGDLVTIGARTGEGKTAFMTKLAVNLALAGIPVLYLTTEMSKYQMLFRILPMLTKIPARAFRAREVSPAQVRHLVKVVADVAANLPIKIMGKGRLSLDDIRAVTYQTKAKVVMVDLIQKCQFPRADNRAYAIDEFMADLKTMGDEMGVLNIIGAQLARQRDKEADRAPSLSDLKDSGGIEANSTHVVNLWRPPMSVLKNRSKMPPKPPEGCVYTEAVVAKNRFGPFPRYADLYLDGSLVEICESAEKQEAVQEELDVPF